MNTLTHRGNRIRHPGGILSKGKRLALAASIPAFFLTPLARAEDCSQCAVNKKLALAYIDRMAHSDIDGALELAAANARFWLSGPGDMDKQGFKGFLLPFNQMILNIRFDVVSVTAQDDRVAVEATSAAELRNGKTYRNHYVFMFTARNGKLAGVKEYSDSAPAQAAFKIE
jgi:ketosteroid isomerase-like protein